METILKSLVGDLLLDAWQLRDTEPFYHVKLTQDGPFDVHERKPYFVFAEDKRDALRIVSEQVSELANPPLKWDKRKWTAEEGAAFFSLSVECEIYAPGAEAMTKFYQTLEQYKED